ncbi:MAG: metal-dependent transcriptional regulator [Erysipelotrichaceae bacterium]|nr:metal-dependent transcriptional regulator [Erysipelotrichaceae bacterium]
MKRAESLEDYLKAIYTLSLDKKIVRAIDVAKYLSFSRPTVSVALKQFRDAGYLTVDDYAIQLTEKGMEIALSVFERHEVLEQILIKLGVDKETAHNDAHLLEHDLSDKSFEAVRKAAKKMMK